MYLLVFVFLILSIIGLYTQLYALQVAQMMSQQKGVGESMLAWHGGAYLFARDSANNLMGSSAESAAQSASGCLLTDITTAPAIAVPGSASSCAHTLLNTDTKYLPFKYSTIYRWYSMVYAPGGAGTTQYVVTFAMPSTPGVATSMIGHPSVGFSPSEILHQLKNAGAPTEAYGLVYGGQFVTIDGPSSMRTFILPTSASIVNGSVGLITPL